jgi:hypothetical protein
MINVDVHVDSFLFTVPMPAVPRVGEELNFNTFTVDYGTLTKKVRVCNVEYSIWGHECEYVTVSVYAERVRP